MIHIRVKKLLKERKINHITVAKYLGITKQAMSLKLSGQREFSIDEINQIRLLLRLTNDEFVNIFFSDK